jgi:hypothetical protein
MVWGLEFRIHGLGFELRVHGVKIRVSGPILDFRV